MTKQEKIREVIAHWLSDYYFRRDKFENRCSTKVEFDSKIGEFQNNEARDLQLYLHSQGVAITVDRELPENPYDDCGADLSKIGRQIAVDEAQKDML